MKHVLKHNTAFKEKERINQFASKQSARQNIAFKEKEKVNELDENSRPDKIQFLKKKKG